MHAPAAAMGAQQAKERERTASSTGSLHSLTLASTTERRPVKPHSKLASARSRDTSVPSRHHGSQAFNVFAEHNGESSAGTVTGVLALLSGSFDSCRGSFSESAIHIVIS